MTFDHGKPVEVYFNLHKKLWSVRQNGKVIGHTRQICLKDAKFVVRQGGRERVLRERKKNVHAFVKGHLLSEPEYCDGVRHNSFESVTYNPYKHNSFVLKYGLPLPVDRAKYVDMYVWPDKSVSVVGTDLQYK